MKLKTLSKKLLVAFFLFVLITVSGVTFGWHLLNKKFINHQINAVVSSLPENVSLKIDEIDIKKSFPYLTIYIKNLSVTYDNKIKAQTRNIEDKISVFKFAAAVLFKETYYGNIHIRKVNAEYINTKNANSSFKKPSEFILLPVNMIIDKLQFKYKNNIFTGKISTEYFPVFKLFELNLKGCLNYIPLELSAKIKQHSIHLNFHAKTEKISKIAIKNIDGDISTKNLTSFNISIKSDSLSYKTVKIQKPAIELSFELLQNGFNISNMQFSSNNGYRVSLNGFLDTKKYPNSNIKGKLSTPYINIKPFVGLIGKNIKDYILNGYVSFSDIKFKGQPSLKFIESGRVYARDFSFRIDKKSSIFVIKKGSIKITPKAFRAIGSGYFEQILFDNSKVTVYRTKGYPCNMDLKYYGTANDLARIFLEENIFSENDLKVLGKTKAFKGKFSATTKVEGYMWGAEPFFNFDVVIHSNGVEFYNSNIPSRFLQSWGEVEIKRIVDKKRKVKTLFVRLKNLKVKGFASSIHTKEFTIFIKPALYFKGKFKANLSKNDFNYLLNSVVGKRLNFSRNSIYIESSIDGKPNNFKFKGNIKYSFILPKANLPIEAQTQGRFKQPLLEISKLVINKKLILSGKINTETLNFNTNLEFDNFDIDTAIKKSMPFNTYLTKGLINGSIFINGNIKGRINITKGNLRLSNGYLSKNINDINALMMFTPYTVSIQKASARIFSSNVEFNGYINYKSNLNIYLNSKTDNITFNLNTFKFNNNAKKTYFEIPKFNINAKAYINNIYLKNKKRETHISNVNIYLKKTKNKGVFSLVSDKTSINIEKNMQNFDIAAKDYAIFAFLTNSNKKNTIFTLKAKLKTENPDKIDIENIRGKIDVLAKNGVFQNVSNTLKILSLTNVFEIILGKTSLQKDLPYKKIVAPLEINKGVIKTRKDEIFALFGKNLNIFATGKYDIMKKYVDVYATFTTLRSINSLISSIPVIGWIIGGKERSFTGVNFHIKGNIDGKLSIKPVPLKGLAKGFLGIIKRTLMLPLHAIGVEK